MKSNINNNNKEVKKKKFNKMMLNGREKFVILNCLFTAIQTCMVKYKLKIFMF